MTERLRDLGADGFSELAQKFAEVDRFDSEAADMAHARTVMHRVYEKTTQKKDDLQRELDLMPEAYGGKYIDVSPSIHVLANVPQLAKYRPDFPDEWPDIRITLSVMPDGNQEKNRDKAHYVMLYLPYSEMEDMMKVMDPKEYICTVIDWGVNASDFSLKVTLSQMQREGLSANLGDVTLDVTLTKEMAIERARARMYAARRIGA